MHCLSKNQRQFETKTETEFNSARQLAISENLEKGIVKSYEDLLSDIQDQKLKQLDINKDEILEKLTEEIVKRYYYTEGVYRQKVIFDETIRKAVTILNDPEEYNSIVRN